MKNATYVQIDRTDPECELVSVSVHDADGEMVEVIEAYSTDEMSRAFAMARRLAGFLELPVKVRNDPDEEPRLATEADFQRHGPPAEKLRSICAIMARVHALADYAWPRDKCGVSPMSDDALRLIIDVQEEASRALGLPEDLNLMTGDELIDLA